MEEAEIRTYSMSRCGSAKLTQKRGIVTILEPYSTKITSATASKLTQFCSRHNNVSQSEIKLNSVFCDWSCTLRYYDTG